MRVAIAAALAMALGSAIAARAWAAGDHADHDMAWYIGHPEAREKQLFACLSTPALNGTAECRNTIGAASKVLGGDNDAFWANKDPAYYRADSAQRTLVLSACQTNRPPPPSWCEAARAAVSPATK